MLNKILLLFAISIITNSLDSRDENISLCIDSEKSNRYFAKTNKYPLHNFI